jgi:hypothetical protein
VSAKEGYGNFTNEYIELNAGQTYQFLVSVKSSPVQDSVHAWIDYNKNGDFDDDERIIFPPIDPNKQSISTFTTRAWPGTDTLRMRVLNQRGLGSPTSCGDFVGEVEDYSVVLTGSGIGLAESLNANDFSAFPNPFNQTLELEWERSQADALVIKVSNSSGQVVFNESISNTGKLRIDTQSWPKGMYLVQFDSDANQVTKLCVKQ